MQNYPRRKNWVGCSLKVRREIHLAENLKERDNLEYLGVNERIIIKWTLDK